MDNEHDERYGRPDAGSRAKQDASTDAQPGGNGLGDRLPVVTLPRGGGALRGLGESFEARAPTGTASLTIPVFTSQSRALTPTIAIAYDSGAGNGPFGLGWVARVPTVRRKTDRGLPRYDDAHASDVFVLADAEDLVPLLELHDGQWVHRPIEREEHVAHRYRPRVEGAFARIERWVARSDGSTHWRTWSRDNVLSIFGEDPQARIADPGYPHRVFEWLLQRIEDDRGNVTMFSYKAEDLAGVSATSPYERERIAVGGPQANRYLKRIRYGNRTPGVADDFAFEVVFDYGEHGSEADGDVLVSPDEERPWPVRADPCSQYRAGFEVRTWRLCRRVLMFHHFPGELGAPLLVRSTDLEHEASPVASLLRRVLQRGYVRTDPARPARYRVQSWPALSLSYTERAIGTAVQTVDAESLRDVPGRIDGHRVRLLDLDGEGLPGLLVHSAGALYYKRPEGAARFGPGRVLPKQPSTIDTPSWSLMDLDGDGRLSLARLSGPSAGAFDRTGAVATAVDGWTAFRPFVLRPTFDVAAANVHVLDATGDGLADVVVFEADRIVCYPSLGRDGFGKPIACGRPVGDERAGPRLLFGDTTRAVFLADMSGDGLTDLVRIENGRVVYWPNLGYGRFGRRVEMGGAPWFDRPDRFRADRIRLGDIDGTGTADLVYLGADGATVWVNASGNRYTPPVEIRGLPPCDGAAAVEITDLLGSGCAALVWSSSLASMRGTHVRYVDLAPRGKPYLLRAVDNGMGLRRTLDYGTSTRAYLEDRASGRPWATRLPFVVHTLERVVVTEAITGHRFATHYRYRHGHYDGAEREFRGFAVVEQIDSESFAEFHGDAVSSSGHQIVDGELFVPPVLTRTRFHTGAWLDADSTAARIAAEDYRGDPSDPTAVAPVRLPGSAVQGDLSAGERREAMRALRGRTLRQEVYALALRPDGTTALERPHPYRVVESNATVRLLQPRAGQRHAVFHVHDREALEQHYERDPSDPRVAHRVVLAVDELGNVTRTATVSYRRRRRPIHGAAQDRTLVAYSESDVVNVTAQDGVYRVGVPTGARSFEVTGLDDADSVLSFEILDAQTLAATEVPFESPPGIGVLRRRLQVSRQLYWSDDLVVPLPLGQVGTRALPHEQRTMVATQSQIATVFAGLLPGAGDGTAVLDDDGGHVADEGAWWAPSGRQVFDASGFFLPIRAIDAFGAEHAIGYDAHRLVVTSVVDPLGNRVSAEHDYRVMQPSMVTDANGNRSQAVFDAMGLVVATIVMGKEGDHDGDTFAQPTLRIEYDLHAFADRGAPASSHTLQREQHVSVDPGARVLESYTHYDGSGRVVQHKAQAEPGLAPRHHADGLLELDEHGEVVLAPTQTRWVGSGRTVVDNKGNPIKQYEPFFSDRPDYDGEDELARTGVTPLLHYDPFGRLVRTDFPDATVARVEIASWQTATFDRNDTVLDSGWFAERRTPATDASERRAAELAAAHANTPTVVHADVLGRAAVTEQQHVVDGVVQTLRTRTVLDIEDNVLAVEDARGNIAETRTYAMGGLALAVDSIDAGWQRTLVDVAGAVLRSWNARGFATRIARDALRRPTHTFVTQPAGSEMVVARQVWGEQVDTPAANNLRTRLFRCYDGAGELTNDAYDFKGNLVAQHRRLARAYATTQDWSLLEAASPPLPANLEALAQDELEDERFAFAMEYDALNRVTSRTTPDASETLLTYNVAGLLESVAVRLRGAATATTIVSAFDYNAKGQRLTCVHGNGTEASYEYDPRTFRLGRLRLVRPGSPSTTLQDLRYTYDPVGNITQIRDLSRQEVFFNNEVVSPDQLFEYDALYRLNSATGREQLSLTQPTNADITSGAQPHPDDPAALRTYEEHYLWDGVGNIVELQHVASGGSFTRRYRYATDGNRLLSSSAPGESSEPFSHSYSYDAHGNMMAMPHLAAMDWDHADRLQHCDLGGGGDVWFVYDASGTRVRKVRVNTSGSSVRERIYLGDYELYRERAANSALPSSERQSLHVADDTGRICLVETRTVAEGDPVITPVSMLRYQHGNHLGSAALELDANAAVISYEEFHPFGTTSYAANDSGIEVSAKRYRYIGKERDEETGLYHLGARYYASWLGKWTASDPIGLADGVNRYAYVAGNPIGARDTTGTAGTTFQPGDVLSREQIAEYQKDRSVAGNTFPVLLPGGDQYYAVPNSAVRIAPGMPGTDAGHLAWSWHGTAGVAWEGRYHETAERLAAAQSNKVGAQRILASKNMVLAVAIISGSIATGVASGGFLTARLMASGAGPLVSSTLGGGTAGAVQSSLSASGLTLLGGGGLRESLAAGVRAAPEGAAMGALSGYYLARVGLGFPSGGGSLSFRPRRTSAAPSGVAESSSPHGTGAGIDDAAAEGGVKKGPIPDQLPANLSEQLTLAEARATPATARPGMTLLADAPRLEANYGAGTWVKMQHVHQMPNNAGQINVHWFRNQTTGQNVEFKFKFRLADKVGVKRPPQEPISPTGTHGFP